jgi:hypothetical protein
MEIKFKPFNAGQNNRHQIITLLFDPSENQGNDGLVARLPDRLG